MIELFALFALFVLACFLGYEMINKVPPTLHTPLMSGTNAISGITILGALLAIPRSEPEAAVILGVAALALATINVIGGYVVTDRMLAMFRRK